MAKVKVKPFEVGSELSRLGLSESIITQALLEGEAERDSCTLNDPATAPGYLGWKGTVRSLRDQLIPRGWERNNDGGYPTVVNHDKTVAIAVSTGDEGIGNPEIFPNTKNPKGSSTRRVVNENQGTLFDFLPEGNPDKKPNTMTWILLKRRDGDTLFAELSLPISITDDGSITGWDTRIIFAPVRFDSEPTLQFNDDSGSAGFDIDIPIIRKVG